MQAGTRARLPRGNNLSLTPPLRYCRSSLRQQLHGKRHGLESFADLTCACSTIAMKFAQSCTRVTDISASRLKLALQCIHVYAMLCLFATCFCSNMHSID